MLTSKHEKHPRHLQNGNSTAISQHITIKQNHIRKKNKDNFYTQLKGQREVALREKLFMKLKHDQKVRGFYRPVLSYVLLDP